MKSSQHSIELEPLIRELLGIEGMMIVLNGHDVVGEMYTNHLREPEFEGSNGTIWGDGWHVHFNLDRITGVQFVEAKDHGIPYLYYVRFSNSEEQTVLRVYFPNPYLDEEERLTEFQPQRLKLFELVRDKYVGTMGIVFARRGSSNSQIADGVP